MWNIIIMGIGSLTIDTAMIFNKSALFNCLGVILDISANSELVNKNIKELEREQIEILEKKDLLVQKSDIVLLCGYGRIIERDFIETNNIVNLHAGDLPKYRGLSANAWAIMNNESSVAYTIHKVVEEIDAGDIYYKKEFEIRKEQSYSDIRPLIIKHFKNHIEEILDKILLGKLKPIKQCGSSVYCSKFTRTDGLVRNFDQKTSRIYNLYRCMKPPLGTGIYFIFQGKEFYVGKAVRGEERGICDYECVPGKIVNISCGELWIKTSDNVICFSDLKDKYGRKILLEQFFIGQNLDV